MGGSLVDAVDKRRAGVDVSAAPEELRPVLDSMLKANPAERLRSMDAVIQMLPDARSRPAAAPPFRRPKSSLRLPKPRTIR